AHLPFAVFERGVPAVGPVVQHPVKRVIDSTIFSAILALLVKNARKAGHAFGQDTYAYCDGGVLERGLWTDLNTGTGLYSTTDEFRPLVHGQTLDEFCT